MLILTLDCRSDSLLFHLFEWEGKRLVARGVVERLAARDSHITLEVPGKRAKRRDRECADHTAALQLLLNTLADPKCGLIADLGSLGAVAHRVPQGGERFEGPAVLAPETLPLIQETLQLAPQLNAPALAGIEGARRLLWGVPQVAVFESAFHRTMPQVASLYAVPLEWYRKHRVRRYGFHGHAHRYAAQRGAALLGRPAQELSLITVHTGEGASLCLVRNGVSVDTSMGFSPLEGVMMEHSCGDIDAGIIPFMMEEVGLTPQEIEETLSRRSGSVGIAGCEVSGPAAQEESRRSPRGRLALEMEGYRLRKYLGAYLAVGNPDAIVFSYSEGWGEWPARGMALKGLEGFGIRLDEGRDREASAGGRELKISADDSRIPVFVVPSGELLVVNAEVAGALGWPP